MSKFDSLYENISWSLRETLDINDVDYTGSKLFDNVRALVDALKNAGLLDLHSDEEVTKFAKAIMAKQENPREFHITGGLDNVKITISGGDSSIHSEEDSDITIGVVQGNSAPVTYTGSQYSDPVDEVVEYIKTLQVKAASPEAAVQTTPSENPASEQPGDQGGASALPGAE
jgi:hypothetical protein